MLSNKKLFLFDIDGTVCQGERLIDGTMQFLEDIRQSGGQFVFITNNSTKSIQDYILKFRVKRAANLLKYSDATLSEISDYVCFNSQSHFGSVFKEFMKMTPRQYREKYKRKEFYS